MSKGGLSKARLARMNGILERYVRAGEVPGVVALLARRGDLHVQAIGALTRGGPPLVRDAIFRIASMTKPVTAVAAMILVEESRVRLDDPVDDLLPELANRRVLRAARGPVADTVPARRPITLRDLLTFTLGLGHVMPWEEAPIMEACQERGILTGPPQPDRMPGPDEWMRRLGELPLAYQPGERWLYDLGTDVAGVLIARAAGQSLGAFMKERIFEPLGMKDTAFSASEQQIGRLTTSYMNGVYDEARGGQWSRPPVFPSGSGGLISTADDYLSFCRMMLDRGRPVLSRASVEVMTANQLSAGQREGTELFLGTDKGWGFGMAVVTQRGNLSSVPGRFGWDGGLGTSAYADPKEGLIGILLTQQAFTSPRGAPLFDDFWVQAYAALED
jgi:CubicO group peptidase (beta-lactamase class C family)